MISGSLAVETLLAMTVSVLSLQCLWTSTSTCLPASMATSLKLLTALSSSTRWNSAWKERALVWLICATLGTLSCLRADQVMH